MLNRVAKKLVGENLDWFFKKVLGDIYDKRRQLLSESNKEIQPIPAIDYVLQECIGQETKYPPESATQWHDYYEKLGLGESHVFQHLLLIYLKLDINNYLTLRERESTTGRQTRTRDKEELNRLELLLKQLDSIPYAFDFPNSVEKLSIGLWAIDNEQMNLMISCLSDPSINISSYFESPRELVKIIVGSLYISCNPSMALFMSRIHRFDGWDDDYDSMYAFLLISSGQLAEALKYERLFIDQENYQEILQRFFELCSKCDVIKAFNCLNLSNDEEDTLNQYLIIESRPTTPSNHIINQSHQQNHNNQTPSRYNNTAPAGRSASKHKHTSRNRSIQGIQRIPSFNDSPARNTRSARKKKVTK